MDRKELDRKLSELLNAQYLFAEADQKTATPGLTPKGKEKAFNLYESRLERVDSLRREFLDFVMGTAQ